MALAFIIGREFVNGAPSALILGDNIYYGNDFESQLRTASARISGATVFAYQVTNPERYGMVDFDAQRHATTRRQRRGKAA